MVQASACLPQCKCRCPGPDFHDLVTCYLPIAATGAEDGSRQLGLISGTWTTACATILMFGVVVSPGLEVAIAHIPYIYTIDSIPEQTWVCCTMDRLPPLPVTPGAAWGATRWSGAGPSTVHGATLEGAASIGGHPPPRGLLQRLFHDVSLAFAAGLAGPHCDSRASGALRGSQPSSSMSTLRMLCVLCR
eukprot:COSAG01_NODE_108_length_25947_cov_25.489593_17_plen_190_part_00